MDKEHNVYGFEGAADRCAYTRIYKEQRMLISFRELWSNTESIRKKHFVVTEGMPHFKNRKELDERIIEMGGIVTDQVDEKTNYLTCNDIHVQIPELLCAPKASIPVLSEIGFIRRFCNVSEFDNIKEISILAEEAWDITCCGGLLDFVMNNGIQPVQMQIWQDGKWV